MRLKTALVFLILIESLFAVPVYASGVIISIQHDNMQSKMMLSFHQNMTRFPNQTYALDGSDPSINGSLTGALQEMDMAAKISQITVNIFSVPNWLNVSISITVSGVAIQQGDILNATTVWKSFHIDTDLRAGNLSYNSVGLHYIRPVFDYYINATRFVGRPNSTINGVDFFLNGTAIAGPQAANQVGNVTLFDFRPLNATLDQWSYKYNLQNDTTTWRYSPAPLMNSSIKVTRHLNQTFTMVANYGYSAEIVASGLARSAGNSVLEDVSIGRNELVMAIIVIVSIAFAVWSQIRYRTKKKRMVRGRRY
jgi:hypothetical protein